MPRPKRQKVAPSARAKAATVDESTIVVEVPQSYMEENAAYNDMMSIPPSDDEVAAPVAKRGRGRLSKRKSQPVQSLPQPADNAAESGDVAAEDFAGDSLLADIELASSSPSVEMGRRDRSSTTFESSFLSVTNFRRRPRQPSILGKRPAQERESSVESSRAVSDNMATMSSRNASTLSIGNFKRRPRQPSVLGRARSSSLGFDTDRGTPAQPGSSLRLGNFRRRARESSVLGTGRKPRQDRPADDDDEEDEFNPEDESTPLNQAKNAAMGSPLAFSSSNPKKRKLSAAKPSQSDSAAATSYGAEEPAAPSSDAAADEFDIPSSPPESPIRTIEVDVSGIEMLNDTMAPPQSSSSPPESPLDSSPPLRGRRPYRGRTPPAGMQDSPISSPPPLTHSPNHPGRATSGPKAKGRRPAPPPSALSTAQLQTLLPRRRRQVNRDPYEIESSEDEVDISGLASDDDELINLSVAPRSRRPVTSFIRRPAPLKKPRGSRNASKTGPEASRGKATYGSRAGATSDKENETYDPDHSLAPLPDDEEAEKSRDVAPTQELKDAARKFQEVDKWELEYEEVTAGSSSPLGAR
jgi:hypothetical protein